VKRGAVYLIHLGQATKPRGGAQGAEGPLIPAVVLTRDALNNHSPTVIVAPIVDAGEVRASYPSDVRIAAPEGGLTVDGIVLTAQVRSVPRARLSRQLGVLSAPVLAQVNRALQVTFALDG
jgi:mRNA interferase MazF